MIADHRIGYRCLYSIFSMLAWGFMVVAAMAIDIRQPVKAGTWYPRTEHELTQMLADLTRQAARTSVEIPADKQLKALILPHAGYVYSGWTAAHASKVLKPGQYSKVVLIGPDHHIGFSNACISDVDAYASPLGPVALHPDAAALRKSSPLFRACPQSDLVEHSLELVLPFLQYYLKSFDIIPIVTGSCNVRPMATAIEPRLDRRTLLVASSDLSHFLSYATAVGKDRRTIAAIMALDADTLSRCRECACGIKPIQVLVSLANQKQWSPVLLHYSNSGDTAGSKNQVVGYAAIAFFGGTQMKPNPSENRSFNAHQGETLLALARDSIANRLGLKPDDTAKTTRQPDPPAAPFLQKCGVFVTLEKQGQLRGCIGNLAANQPVWDGIKDNAVNAAFHDPRFSPLSPDELAEVKISVSILTPPRRLDYRDSADLVDKLRPHVDGVILKQDAHSATFLPQVWDQLPTADRFLSHLCVKAGLPANAWQTAKPEVLTYQVQYFEEH